MVFKEYLKRGFRYILAGVPEKKVTAEISCLTQGNLLQDKHIVVTGGAKGIGLAITKKCLSEGANVLITGRDEASLRNVSEKYGCKYLVLDMCQTGQFETFMSEANDILDGVNCLVNNAGISLHEGDIRNVTEEQFDMQIATNLKGPYFLSQKFVEIYEKSLCKSGNIIFISSERGFQADDLPYGLTKCALNSLVQGLARRLIDSGIRVNAVAPGVTATDMTGFSPDSNLYCSYNVTERVYLPEEVADIVCYLLSDVSNCLSGQILVCNEGKTINSR